jgi:oxalate decarboxylase/phosphoglucose isomerase-like protein (cupin superfamily)
MMPTMEAMEAQFARDGYIAPLPVLDEFECAFLRRHLKRPDRKLDETKARAVVDPVFQRLGSRRVLLDAVTRLLGEDVVLFAACIVRREPGMVHPWHSDIETCDPAGGFVSAWIGLTHTCQASALQLIPGSHRLGRTVQEVAQEKQVGRDDRLAEHAVEWVRETDPDAQLLQPDVRDGQAILFDGRLWHGSHNTHTGRVRTALLLQYAAASRTLRVPDFSQLDWPFKFQPDVQPPALVVAGRAATSVNQLIPPLPHEHQEGPMLKNRIHPIRLPLQRDRENGWIPHPQFQGATPIVADMACHVSVLEPGHSPHPPHIHPEEELLIVLDGEGTLMVGDSDDEAACEAHPAPAGTIAYYPAFQYHTIRNRGDRPVTYLMLKWRDGEIETAEHTGATIFSVRDDLARASTQAFDAQQSLERTTDWLSKVHCHTSVLEPGGGYEPHVDAHDVAIIMMDGVIEANGQQVEPHGIVYHPAGQPHGIHNPGNQPARYVVFEFHARDKPLSPGRRASKLKRDVEAGLRRVYRGIRRRLR